MIDYLELFHNGKDKKICGKNLEKEKRILCKKIFSGTQKLWKSSNPKANVVKMEKTFARKFIKNDKKVAYFEIFEEQRAKLMGISKNISFIFLPCKDNSNEYDKNNCIGFRYFESSIVKKCNYFTLIKAYDKRFFILEKEKSILDIDGNSFYDEELNCYSIMKNIIFEKYKNKTMSFPMGELFPEIIGYIYSIISLGKVKGFITIEPLILDPLNDESRVERLPEELEENIGYIEPILFDNHISVVFIKKSSYNNRGRVNMIFDMSRYHLDNNILDNTVFPTELYLNNYQYPKFSIQKGSSCGLWFYGIMELVYSNDKYKVINDVCFAINKNSYKFVLDVINFLSDYLYNIQNIIDDSNINISKIQEKRFYDFGLNSAFSFQKESIMSYYFSLASLFGYQESNSNKTNNIFGIDLLLEYQFLFDNIKSYLNLVEFNDNYFKIYSPKQIYEKHQKNEYKKISNDLKSLLIRLYENYGKLFNMELYHQFEDKLKYGILSNERREMVKTAFEKIKKEVEKVNIKDLNKFIKEFNEIKFADKKVAIKEESIIIKYLNPNNDFGFQLMNK